MFLALIDNLFSTLKSTINYIFKIFDNKKKLCIAYDSFGQYTNSKKLFEVIFY